MNRKKWRVWTLAILAATSIHGGVLAGISMSWNRGAQDMGESGIEVGIGQLGESPQSEAGLNDSPEPSVPEPSEPEPQPAQRNQPEEIPPPEPQAVPTTVVTSRMPSPNIEKPEVAPLPRVQTTRVATTEIPSAGRGIDPKRGGVKAAMVAYANLIKSKLVENAYYPKSSRVRGHQGYSTVLIVLSRDGTLLDSRVSGTSKSRPFDDAMTDIVQLSAPFPPVPAEIAGAQIKIRIAFNWSLVEPR